jgi:HlyD family secretion protein
MRVSTTSPAQCDRLGRVSAWLVAVPLALAPAVLLTGVVPVPWSSPGAASSEVGAPVRRGPLRIAVTAAGSLSPAETTTLSSGVEGRTTILDIVPEGSQVTKGQIVCELDATTMAEQRIQQSIEVGNAQAALVKARQNLEIQKSQNLSDANKAKQAVDFAQQDLQMFLEGERDSELEAARQAIDLAREESQRARDRVNWSEKLADKGFLTSTEFEADRIAEHRAKVALEQALRELDLLERFRMPRRASELQGLLAEAHQELARVDLQSSAKLVDFEAALLSGEAVSSFEREKLARLEAQIEKARLRAPRDGFVVYAQRDSDEPPIQAGAEVREREVILSIPSSDGMVAQVKLHESVLKQVQPGQPCTIRVDAMPGTELEGAVTFVAMLPDQNSRWTNPNLRVYRADVAVTSPSTGLRPGMSCSVEILIDELEDALYVPVQAVFRELQSNICFVARGSRVERREVEIGRYNDLWVQVTKGLAEGEVVLLQAPVGTIAPTPKQEVESDPPPAAPAPATPENRPRRQRGADSAERGGGSN